jgi:hypothetical protein
MSKKIIISEQEKTHILGLYGLINEEIDPNVGGTVTLTNKYQAGFYTVNAIDTVTNKQIKDQLDVELAKVTEFVKKYPNSIVSIKFISQESAIPNKDNEGYHGKSWLEPGGLSDLRKSYLEQYIKRYFDSLKSTGVIPSSVEVPPLEYEKKATVTPWVGTPFCPDGSTLEQQRSTCFTKYKAGKETTYKDYYDKYQSEQNTSIVITVQIKKEQTTGSTVTTTTTKKIIKEECVAGITIRVYVPRHQCQNAEFFLFANETLLYNVAGGYTANLNNVRTSRGVPTMSNKPYLPAPFLNPGYGELKNGDGTFNYGFGKGKIMGDIGGPRSDTFIITPSQASEIVNQSSDGLVTFYFIATTDDVHDDIPVFEVTKDGKSLLVDSKGEKYKPNRGSGKLFSIDACGKTVDTKSNKLSKSEKGKVVGLRAKYVQQLVNERLDTAKKPGFLAKMKNLDFSDEPDQKAIDLSRAEELLTKMTDLVLNILEKDPDYYSTNTKLTDGNYENQYSEFYKLIKPETGIDFQRKSGIGGLPNTFVYSDDIQKNKLYQDVKRRLDEFYQAFDTIYYDKTKKVVVPSGNKNRMTIVSNLKKIPTWRELSQAT